MAKREIFFNEKKKEYTLEREGNIKKVPIKFKVQDKTAKYREEILEKEIFNS